MDNVQETKVIKRYSNRKLYDTKESQYITLKKLVEEIRGGQNVVVVDNVSKIDITVPTLLSAIVETENDTTVDANTLLNVLREGGLTKYKANNLPKV